MRVGSTSAQYRYPLQYVLTEDEQDYLVIHVDLTRVRDGDMEVDFVLTNAPSRLDSSPRFTQSFALTRPTVEVTVARLMEADRPFVEQQRVCPVIDAVLGEHGPPIKLVVGNQPFFVCCEGCIDEVKKNPRQYLEKLTSARANSKPSRPQVNVALAVQADAAAIRAQGTCPVMNQPLGAHGRPIKVIIDGRVTFVCCEGCVDTLVQSHGTHPPEANGPAVTPGVVTSHNQQTLRQPTIAVGYALAVDRPAVEAQGICPVTSQQLGGHGTPLKVTIDSQPVFVCCQACVDKVQQDPELYVSRVIGGRQPERYGNQSGRLDQKMSAEPGGSGGSCCSDNKKGSCCN